LRFTDAQAGLGLTLHYRMRDDFDVTERWATLTHDGIGPDLELLRAEAATWSRPHRDTWRLSRLHGRWAVESRLVRSELTCGEKIIGSRRSPTGHQHGVLLHHGLHTRAEG